MNIANKIYLRKWKKEPTKSTTLFTEQGIKLSTRDNSHSSVHNFEVVFQYKYGKEYIKNYYASNM